MGHGGESTVYSPQNHHSSYHQPHVGGPNSKKTPHNVTKVNTPGGGSCHDNSKGSFSSSKVTKKMHSHSTPQTHSKPVSMGKPRHFQQGKVEYVNSAHGNKSNLALHKTPFHVVKQHQQASNFKNQVPRQKSFSPPTLHPMPSGEAYASSSVMPGSKQKEHFYAGARFETHPSHIGLPVPPSHWTAPLQRSQSQPSSPVPTSLPQKGISVDLATLFGYSDSALKSASFPGERLMDSLVKMEEERNKKSKKVDVKSIDGQCFGSLEKAQGTKNEEKSSYETDELKKALGLASFTSVNTAATMNNGGFNSCGSEMSPPTKYQDISDQLKTLLKVAA